MLHNPNHSANIAQQSPPLLDDSGSLVEKDVDKAEILNAFFVRQASQSALDGEPPPIDAAPITEDSQLLPWPKKRTILEIRGEKNAVPGVISSSIRRDQCRAKVADSRGSRLPCADRA